MILDPIAAHVIATTADAGAKYARTHWALYVARIVASRQIRHEQRMLNFKRRANITAMRSLIRDLRSTFQMTHQRNDTPEPLAGNLPPADRAMLERAASAAGLRVQWDEGTRGFIRLSDSGVDVDSWNPLDSEEDAEALRVKLGLKTGKITKLGAGPAPIGMHALMMRGNVAHTWSAYLTDEGVTDLKSARRRAIVSAAADPSLKGGA